MFNYKELEDIALSCSHMTVAKMHQTLSLCLNDALIVSRRIWAAKLQSEVVREGFTFLERQWKRQPIFYSKVTSETN